MQGVYQRKRNRIKTLDMVLKEKIQTIIIDDYGNLQKILLLEKIADDYVIEFGVWLSINCQQSASKDGFWLYENRWKTINELLEIFKKEKGW